MNAQPSILNEIRKVEITYDINHLDHINSNYSEFSPVYYQDKLLFVSDQEFDFVNYGENRWKRHPLLNIFAVDVTIFANDSTVFSDPELFEDRFRSLSHSGPITFSKDGKIAVFTQVTYQAHKNDPKVKVHKPQLFYSIKTDGEWTKPQRLPFVDVRYAYGHPSFSDDNVLYFSSDVEGGQGGDDLYLTRFDGSQWEAPANLGATVNSNRDEVFPHYFDSTLYFSSGRKGGIGGLDIYRSELGENGFLMPEPLDTPMNSVSDDFGIFFTSENMGYVSSSREGGKGKDDIYRFIVNEKVTVESNYVAGKFTYRNLDDDPANNLDVMLMDEDGNIVMKTQTNDNGEFIFKNLDGKESYLIKVQGEDQDLQLEIFYENGKKTAYMVSDSRGQFVYKLLDSDNVGTLSLIDEEDVDDNLADLNGQFVYEQLPGENASGLKVMLIDEDGNIQYTTTTDEHGNFTFKNLPMDENYVVRMEEVDTDLTLIIFNDDDNVTAILRMDGKGDFVFRKLDSQYNNNLDMLEMEDEDLLSDLQGNIYGQFEYKNLDSDFNDGLEFEVLDENGDVVIHSVTDKEGFFRLAGLPLSESYVFRIPPEENDLNAEIKLTILNRNGKKVALLDKDKHGYFVYTPLGLSGSINLKEMDFENTDFDAIMKIPTLYYDADSYRLDWKAKKVLNKLVAEMKENKDIKVEVNSYADSRASEEYNLKLSEKRTKSVIRYLVSRGISEDRIGGNAYGESKLLNDCEEGVKCPDELHRLNRRSEIRVY